jgi:hypothetical protein
MTLRRRGITLLGPNLLQRDIDAQLQIGTNLGVPAQRRAPAAEHIGNSHHHPTTADPTIPRQPHRQRTFGP